MRAIIYGLEFELLDEIIFEDYNVSFQGPVNNGGVNKYCIKVDIRGKIYVEKRSKTQIQNGTYICKIKTYDVRCLFNYAKFIEVINTLAYFNHSMESMAATKEEFLELPVEWFQDFTQSA